MTIKNLIFPGNKNDKFKTKSARRAKKIKRLKNFISFAN